MRAAGSTLMRSGRLRAGSSSAEDGASKLSIADQERDGDGGCPDAIDAKLARG